jgi:hypothetical protein
VPRCARLEWNWWQCRDTPIVSDPLFFMLDLDPAKMIKEASGAGRHYERIMRAL